MSENKPQKNIFIRLCIDAILCACFIFTVIQVIQLIPINSNWFQPASNAFKDFDWSDIYFSKIKTLHNSETKNQNILVINIDDASRKDIANVLFKLSNAEPKVIGLDVLFKDAIDSATDALLDSSIRMCGKKIIVACFADSTSGNSIYSFQPMSIPKLTDADNTGYVNFIGDDNQTIRSFYKVEDFRLKKIPSFAFNTFLKFNDKGDFESYKIESSAYESIIPYQSLPEHYSTFNYHEILEKGFNWNLLKNKIVLIGYAGNDKGWNVIDDKHFTPLNENYAGKALPDMFGVFIHANIIEGFITKYQVNQPSRFLQEPVCIIFIFLFLMLYLYSESKEHLWQSVVEITLQIIFAFVLIMLAIYFLSSYGMKWDIGEMIAAVALAEPLIGFYRVLIHFLGKVYHFNSIFKDED